MRFDTHLAVFCGGYFFMPTQGNGFNLKEVRSLWRDLRATLVFHQALAAVAGQRWTWRSDINPWCTYRHNEHVCKYLRLLKYYCCALGKNHKSLGSTHLYDCVDTRQPAFRCSKIPCPFAESVNQSMVDSSLTLTLAGARRHTVTRRIAWSINSRNSKSLCHNNWLLLMEYGSWTRQEKSCGIRPYSDRVWDVCRLRTTLYPT